MSQSETKEPFDQAKADWHNAYWQSKMHSGCKCRQYRKPIHDALQGNVTPFRLMLMWLGGLDVSDGHYPFVVNPKEEWGGSIAELEELNRRVPNLIRWVIPHQCFSGPSVAVFFNDEKDGMHRSQNFVYEELELLKDKDRYLAAYYVWTEKYESSIAVHESFSWNDYLHFEAHPPYTYDSDAEDSEYEPATNKSSSAAEPRVTKKVKLDQESEGSESDGEEAEASEDDE